MSLSLLDIYNKVTAQSWSIYETDQTASGTIEKSVVIAIQKALRTLWNAHDYCFRLKNKRIQTRLDEMFYTRPDGNIVKNGIKIIGDSEPLSPVHYTEIKDYAVAKPQCYYIKYNRLGFYPIPDDCYDISVDYNTFRMGRNSQNQSVYNLTNLTDTLDVPEMFEDLFLHALINKSMLNALASNKTELYQPYLQQFLETYKNLILNSAGMEFEKEIKW